LTFSHTDQQYGSIFQFNDYYLMGSRDLINGSLAYEADPWTVQFYANNIANKLYVSGYANNLEYYGNPRQLGVRVQRNF
jgi:outer membrane receptor protein involved in Fe transport